MSSNRIGKYLDITNQTAQLVATLNGNAVQIATSDGGVAVTHNTAGVLTAGNLISKLNFITKPRKLFV